MIIIIDNYDSFTYNLFQYVGELYSDILVLKNDDQKIKKLNENDIQALIFSPGPGRPQHSGLMPNLIKRFYPTIPILGICLGHQAIIENFGGKIINASEVWHGKVDTINHLSNCPIFNSINFEFKATRYHSLVSSKNIPDCLEVTAISKNDHEIMAVKHIKHKIFGLQFHPESIETIDGKKMIENFINVI